MKSAAVSELKASLSEYLGKVKAGEEVIITDRGKPVAKLVPLERDVTDMPPYLLSPERAGLVRIGTGNIPREFWQKRRPVDRKGEALTGVLREREEGR
jgi:prevent-host-death family protein